jgi:hypothetical protein
MPRKKRTAIKGSDPAYTSDFSQPLPTHKVAEKPEPIPSPKVPSTQPVKPQKSEPKAKAEPAPKPTPKPIVKAVQPAAKPDVGEKREIALSAAVKVEQNEKLTALEAKGISAKDAITLAGRRAVEQFEPKAAFVEKTDTERMPMRQGYKSTKRIPAAMLDQLRQEHDHLGLSSDGARMRGQFEPLFWSCLDAVIEELNSKY